MNITLDKVSTKTVLASLVNAEWAVAARPAQLAPEHTAWHIWLVLAGRGWGKTLAGARDLARFGLLNHGARLGIVAPTHAAARDICVEGASGLLSFLPAGLVKTWNRSQGELLLHNDSIIKLFSADEPERLRGPQHHRVWADELAAWSQPTAFDQVLFGLRLGATPRLVITTTPKPTALIKTLVARAAAGDGVVMTRGHTLENESNLAPGAVAELMRLYGASRLGRQELAAEILDDSQHALFNRAQIDALRRSAAPPSLNRVVVAVDPALSAHEGSDETGIIVAARDAHGNAHVLADGSGVLRPEAWAARVAALAETYSASEVIVEVNAGGDLVTKLLQQTTPHLVVRAVRASKSKSARAIPIAALYEQGRVHHIGALPKLEDQLCRLTLDGFDAPSHHSPDRADACIWALTELMLKPSPTPSVRSL